MFDAVSSTHGAAASKDNTTTVINGINYNFLSWPGEKSPTIIAIHGLGDAPDSFCGLGEDSRRSQQLFSFSLRGTGGSSALPKGLPYSIDTFREDLLNFMDHFAITKAILVGASFAGLPALHVAQQDPTRVKGLVLVDSLPVVDPRAVNSARTRFSREWPDRVELLRDFAKTTGVSESEAAALLETRILHEFSAWRYKVDPALLGLLTTDFYAQFVEDARRISCPVLCMRSGVQSVVPKEAWDALDTIIPNAKVQLIPEARHSIMRSAPRAFNDSLLQFVVECTS